MASTELGPPAKRQKTGNTMPSTSSSLTHATNILSPSSTGNKELNKTMPEVIINFDRPRDDAEAKVGILHYVTEGVPGFTGVLKQRYVNLICSL